MEMSGQVYPQEKSPWHLLDRKLGGPKASLGVVLKKKSPASAGNQTQVIQPVNQSLLIELPWYVTFIFITSA
jgi:hypothetical protein